MGRHTQGLRGKSMPFSSYRYLLYQGTHCTGKTGKMAKKKIPVRENTGNLEILPKHREFGLFKL